MDLRWTFEQPPTTNDVRQLTAVGLTPVDLESATGRGSPAGTGLAPVLTDAAVGTP